MVQGVLNPGDLLAEEKKREKDQIADDLMDGFDVSGGLGADDYTALSQHPDLLSMILEDDSAPRISSAPTERFEFAPDVHVEVSDWGNDSPSTREALFSLHTNNEVDAVIHNMVSDNVGDIFGGSAIQEIKLDQKEREKKERENRELSEIILRRVLRDQMRWLQDEIGRLKDSIEKYNAQLEAMGIRLETLTEAMDQNAANRDKLEGMDQDMTLTQMYQGHYRDKILSGDQDSLMNALQNPLTVDGNVVYSDETGQFYRLRLDEQGDPLLNEKGQPEREYYKDFAPEQIPQIMNRVINGHELLGQYSPAGRDPLNMRFHELIDIKDLPQDVCDHLNHVTPVTAAPPSPPHASSATIGDMVTICDETQCLLIKEHDMTVEQKAEVERMRAEAEAEKDEKSAQLENLENQAREEGIDVSDITAGDKAAEEKAADTKTQASAQSSGQSSLQSLDTPAPVFSDGKLPEAIASQIEGGKLDAETLSFAMAHMSNDQKASLLRNLESQGVQLSVSTTSFIDPALAPYIKDEQKPQAVGGNGVYAHVPDASENLPVVEAKATSFARSLDNEERAPSKMNMSFASAAKGPLPAPEPAPAAPAPEQNLNHGLVA